MKHDREEFFRFVDAATRTPREPQPGRKYRWHFTSDDAPYITVERGHLRVAYLTVQPSSRTVFIHVYVSSRTHGNKYVPTTKLRPKSAERTVKCRKSAFCRCRPLAYNSNKKPSKPHTRVKRFRTTRELFKALLVSFYRPSKRLRTFAVVFVRHYDRHRSNMKFQSDEGVVLFTTYVFTLRNCYFSLFIFPRHFFVSCFGPAGTINALRQPNYGRTNFTTK